MGGARGSDGGRARPPCERKDRRTVLKVERAARVIFQAIKHLVCGNGAEAHEGGEGIVRILDEGDHAFDRPISEAINGCKKIVEIHAGGEGHIFERRRSGLLTEVRIMEGGVSIKLIHQPEELLIGRDHFSPEARFVVCAAAFDVLGLHPFADGVPEGILLGQPFKLLKHGFRTLGRTR